MAPGKPSGRLAKTSATKNKKNSSLQKPERKAGLSSPTVPLDLQQSLLNIFRNAFPARSGPDLKPLLQEVKQHLYNRDFLKAFGKDEYLEAYAVRWSPSRALGYTQIFDDVLVHVMRPKKEPGDHFKIVCLGGGAGAEIVGLAGFLKLLMLKKASGQTTPAHDDQVIASSVAGATNLSPNPPFDIVAVDIANWSPITIGLQQAITTPPTLSKYASAAARDANIEFLRPEAFQTNFIQQDVLTMTSDDFSNGYKDVDLVTIMFTLNELYSTSLGKTQSFLLKLTGSLQPGAQLLVVDSPGSYSTIALNDAEKKYPMHWLLDHTLLSTPKDAKPEETGPKWEKLLTDESRWFRLPEGLKYPIDLENMRYQIHLYRRLP